MLDPLPAGLPPAPDAPDAPERVRARLFALLAETRGAALPPPAARRAIRKRAGLTLGETAALVGVHVDTLARWERGSHAPTGANRDAYSAALAVLSDEAVRRAVADQFRT